MSTLNAINDAIYRLESIPPTRRRGETNQALIALRAAREDLEMLKAKNEALVTVLKEITKD